MTLTERIDRLSPIRLFLGLVLAGLVVGAITSAERLWTAHRLPALDFAVAGDAPANYSETLARADENVARAQERARLLPGQWLALEGVVSAYLAHARLTGSFDDYGHAADALAIARAEAPARSGPVLSEAVFNFTIHRLAATERALGVIDHFAVPADGDVRAEAAALRGDILFYRGRYAEALRQYRAAEAIDGGPGIDFRYAVWRAKTGDVDGARAAFDAAQRSVAKPSRQFLGNLELQRGIIDLNVGGWSDAAAHFAKADRLFPGFWLIEEHVAETKGLSGDLPGAMRAYLGIVRRTGNPEAMDALAGLARSAGDVRLSQLWAARAETIWEARLKRFPEAAYAHALDHYLAFGDPRRALAIAQANYVGRPYGDAAIGLAWAWLANQRADLAVDAIEPVLRSGWVTAEQHVVAAEAYALLGRGADADVQHKAALAINPKSFDRNPAMIWLDH